MLRSKSVRNRKQKAPIRNLSVGHDAIDADHEAIVECCNEIANATSSALEFQLHRLRALLAAHFQNEETLLKSAGSNLCGCHTRDHELFLEFCDRAIQANRGGSAVSRRLILRELLPALREHIAYRDQLIALHLNTLDSHPAPPACTGRQ